MIKTELKITQQGSTKKSKTIIRIHTIKINFELDKKHLDKKVLNTLLLKQTIWSNAGKFRSFYSLFENIFT